MHTRFNHILEELLSNKKQHYIIDLDSKINDVSLFTQFNELNDDGIVAFWQEIDDCIRLFDDHQLSLTPAQDPSRSDNRNNSAVQQRVRLPPLKPSMSLQRQHSSKYTIQRPPTQHHASRNRVWVNKKFFDNHKH